MSDTDMIRGFVKNILKPIMPRRLLKWALRPPRKVKRDTKHGRRRASI